MKRLRIFLGAGAFLLCIVTPLFAQQMDIKTTGHIRVRYRDWNDFLMDDNLAVQGQVPPPGQTSQAAAQAARNRHYFDYRIRMGVTAKIEPGLTAVMELERWDDFGSHSLFNATPSPLVTVTTATGTSQTTAGVQGFPTNTDAPYFRQAFVDWVIPGTPIHIAGGRMLYTVGGSIVFSSVIYGGDGIQAYSALGPGTLGVYYFKPQNGQDTATSTGDRRFANNDFDIYGGSYKFEWMARNGVEIYGLLSNDKQRAPGASVYCGGVTTSSCGDTSEYFVGANFFGVQGPFTYRLEGAYQGGTARKNVTANAGGLGVAAGDIDRSAGMIVGGVSYALVPQLSLNLDGGWASGDDNPRDNEHNNFASIFGLFAPTTLFTQANPAGNTFALQYGNNTTNRAIFTTTMGTSDLDLNATLDNNNARFSPGMFYAKPGVKWVPVKQLTINADVALLWAAVTPGGVDSYIGTEADIQATWAVYKNLVVNWYFGYLFAGSYFDTGGTLRNNQVLGNAHNVTDPWFSQIEFIVTF